MSQPIKVFMRAGRLCQGGGVRFGVHFEMVDPYPPEKGLVKTPRFIPQASPLQNQLPIGVPNQTKSPEGSLLFKPQLLRRGGGGITTPPGLSASDRPIVEDLRYLDY